MLDKIVNNLIDIIINSVKYGVEVIREKIEFYKLIREANEREIGEKEEYEKIRKTIWQGGVTNKNTDDEITESPSMEHPIDEITYPHKKPIYDGLDWEGDRFD